jgi:hypothetical protein
MVTVRNPIQVDDTNSIPNDLQNRNGQWPGGDNFFNRNTSQMFRTFGSFGRGFGSGRK